ncbi:LysM domain-containing protein [Alkalihalobacillus sp. LMS39]|uniref:LysM peptidoglycan-binding domain-containing protein n=1 Tax=Alkalihalobacillus sp. LMS39 TaxID=2924032 RepID=UPI001FB51307|nr:LysM domain-containing protein [Alkalihalobacillus sp. LMS39]UOE95812.1 LysM peptidoglycan-binding domain-containing protein [Alkalihalobacillus sp. LMS39]
MRKFSKILVPTLAIAMVLGGTSLSVKAETKTIEQGDTMWGIAENHDVSVEELKAINPSLHPLALPIGTEVQLGTTTENSDNVTHVVQPGNTLWSISQLYEGVSLDHLLNVNSGVDPYYLPVGSEVTVVERTETNENVVYHTIQPGNTITEIANVYDYVSVEDVLEANETLDPYSLTVGATVAIPLR